MSSNSGAYDITIFLLVLNIVTPIFVYAMTDISMSQTGYEAELAYLDEEDLLDLELKITVDERGLLTWEGTPVEFVNLSQPYRIDWVDPVGLLLPDSAFRFYTRRWPSINPFWLPGLLNFRPVWIEGQVYSPDVPSIADAIAEGRLLYPTNDTIIEAWDFNKSWARISQRQLGLEMFITCEKYGGNITDAIEAGELNVTTGELYQEDDFDARKFVSFYSGMVTGYNEYNLPVAIAWIFRVELILFTFSLVIIIRDLLPV